MTEIDCEECLAYIKAKEEWAIIKDFFDKYKL